MPGMTITEKILARHAGRERVVPGEIVYAKVDLVMGNELSALVGASEFERIGIDRVFDPAKIALVPDHFVPAKDIRSAEVAMAMRRFVATYKFKHYFEVGRGGIAHVVIPDEGLCRPGDLIIGGDSHTCTYGALNCYATGIGSTDMAAAMATGEIWIKVPKQIRMIFRGRIKGWTSAKDLVLHACGKLGVSGARAQTIEFTGDTIESLDMAGRLTIANLTIEMGGENGVMACDDVTLDYLRRVIKEPERFETIEKVEADPDASYAETIELDVDDLPRQVACPMRPDNVKPLREVEGAPLDQVVIGSCTNGRMEDLRAAAEVMKGRQVASTTRCIIVPGSQRVWTEAAKEGLLSVFAEAGCAVSTSTCGPCVGGHMGVLGPGEVCLSTTSRNVVGRMGHKDAKVYLSSPAVAAASAVAGKIADPEDLIPEPRGVTAEAPAA